MLIQQQENKPLKILRVETGFLDRKTESDKNYLDYCCYQDLPQWLRVIEKILRLDIYLALKARKIADNYDIIWARSEKVGIPLSMMGLKKPLVLSAHYLESPLRTALIKSARLAKKWAAVGYYSEGQKNYLIDTFGISEKNLFFSEVPHYLYIDPNTSTYDGPIISLGVSKRDYLTLVNALATLDGCYAVIYSSSKFGDRLSKKIKIHFPEWIKIVDFIPQCEIIKVYQNSRFVIVPLQATKQTGAGLNAIYEAGAFGKAVIATRNEGTEAFIRDGETGILVPPNDVEAMRAAINTLWQNPDLAKKMGMAGRKFIETKYHPDKIHTRRNQLFARIFQEYQSR